MSEPIPAEQQVPRGVAYPILAEHVEQFWPSVEGMLRSVETWTMCLAADDIRRCLADGRMQLWSVFDQAGKVALAITRIATSARGGICNLWLIAAPFSDDASIDALLAECEGFARLRNCIVLEIHAIPFWQERISGKLTGLIFERDLQAARGVH